MQWCVQIPDFHGILYASLTSYDIIKDTSLYLIEYLLL